MGHWGRFFIILGIGFIALGGMILFMPRISGLGKLPGDIEFHRGNFSFYFPLTTSIIISILLSLFFIE